MIRNKHGLVHLSDVPPVPRVVVLFVGHFLWIFPFLLVDHETILWAHVKVNVVNFVSSLVIACQNCGSDYVFLDFFDWVVATSFLCVSRQSLVPIDLCVFNKLQNGISPEYFVNDVDVQEDAILQLVNCRRKSRPNFNVVFVDVHTLIWVEMVSANLFEVDPLDQAVEEYFHVHHHVSVLITNLLHPLNFNLVFYFFVGVLEVRHLSITSKCIDVVSKVNEEPNLFLKLFFQTIDQLATDFL